MRNNLLVNGLRIIGCLLWAVFVNAIAMWIIGPLVQDLAIFGVLAVVVIAVLWLSSLLPESRRRWVSFTLFSLLLGQGLSLTAFSSLSKTVVVGAVMVIGLFVIALWFGKVRLISLFAGTIGIIAASVWLPFSDWPFLTQFNVVNHSRLHIQTRDMDAVPFDVIHTSKGDAIVTVNSYVPPASLLQQLVKNATDSPEALQNALQTAQGEYQLVEIRRVGGRIVETTPSPADLAKVNPMRLINTFVPFQLAHWDVTNHRVAEYLTPYMTGHNAVELALKPSVYSNSMKILSDQAVADEMTNWSQVLGQLGVQANLSGWQIQSGHLLGTYQGKSINLPVAASTVVGQGHFTSKTADELLLVGNNDLQILNLSSGKIVSTFHGTPSQPVPNDVIFGPLSHGELDAVFVNASPAYILQANADGSWKTMYTATSPSFRFETVMRTGKRAPQIVTDDPSKIRNSPTRYFSAYRFVPGSNGTAGTLEREWRVFRTNVVNVTPISMNTNGVKQLAVAIYGTGEYLILQKMNLPVLQIAYVVLGLIIVAGWIRRTRRRTGGRQA